MPLVPLAARIVNPIVWVLPGHAVHKLEQFALAEHGSLLDMTAAANRCEDPDRAAAYLRHALDEGRHSQMFVRRARELAQEQGRPRPGRVRADTEHLFQTLGEVDFLAFVHRGESTGRQQFESYQQWFRSRGDVRTEQLFKALVHDELRHEAYSLELLTDLVPAEQVSAAFRKMWMRDLWHGWLRLGRPISHGVYLAGMLLLYPLLWPFALWVRVVRPRRSGW